MQLVGASTDLATLHTRLFALAPREGAAFLGVVPTGNRLLLRTMTVFSEDDLDQSHGGVSVREDAKVRELAALKRQSLALVDVHTHPGSGKHVAFSPFDESELPPFARYVRLKLGTEAFGALVLGESGYAGSVWRDVGVGPLAVRPVGELGATPQWADRETPPAAIDDVLFDRQIRCLGDAGQRRIQRLHVAVVGLGGTGSQVVQQLGRIGIRRFTLVEDDRVERSNLPRLAGASWWDSTLRRSKVSVARRTLRHISRGMRVRSTGSLRRLTSLRELATVDIIVGCVDNDGARLVLAEVAAAHLVPYLDIGVGIEPGAGAGTRIGGRIAFFVPGGACLACADELDFAEAREDLDAEMHRIRVARGYASDRAVEAALMPLNGALVSLAMLELIAYATGIRPVMPFSRFDVIRNAIIRQVVDPNPDCPVCVPAYAMGDRHHIERYALG